MKKHLCFIGICLIFLAGLQLSGCKHKWKSAEKYDLDLDSLKNQYIVIADSIRYGVEVKPRKESDQWQVKWLSSLDRRELVDFIFDEVYSGRLKPYNYFSGKPMTIDQVRALEKKDEFDRSKIGKIQFNERWYFDPVRIEMFKEVYSIMFAYENYRDNGEFRGYVPAFKVYLNTPMIEK